MAFPTSQRYPYMFSPLAPIPPRFITIHDPYANVGGVISMYPAPSSLTYTRHTDQNLFFAAGDAPGQFKSTGIPKTTLARFQDSPHGSYTSGVYGAP